jgi:ribosomal protein L24
MAPRKTSSTKETPEQRIAKRIKSHWNIASANVRMLDAALKKSLLEEKKTRLDWIDHCEKNPDIAAWDSRIIRYRKR